MHDLFISYSSKDESIVRQVLEKFKENKLSFWFAPEQLEGKKHDEEIVPAIKHCKVFIIFLSQYSRPREGFKASSWVRDELLTAREYSKCILPIKLDDTVDEETNNLMFKGLPNYIDLTAFVLSLGIERIVQMSFGLLDDDRYKKSEIDAELGKKALVESLFKEIENCIKQKSFMIALELLQDNKILYNETYKFRTLMLKTIVQMSQKTIRNITNSEATYFVETLRPLRKSEYAPMSLYLEALIAQEYFVFNGMYDNLTEGYKELCQEAKNVEKISLSALMLTQHIKTQDPSFGMKWMQSY